MSRDRVKEMQEFLANFLGVPDYSSIPPEEAPEEEQTLGSLQRSIVSLILVFQDAYREYVGADDRQL